jgi:putative nucleotidyltransferase with HDIG domain
VSATDAPVLWRGTPGGHRFRPERAGEILRLLSRMRRHATLYGTDHPVVTEVLRDLHEFLQVLLSRRPVVRLFVHQDTFLFENTALLEESLQYYSLLIGFRERHINAVQFDRGVEPWELQHFVEMLNLNDEDILRPGGADAYLVKKGVTHIKAGAVEGTEGAPPTAQQGDSDSATRMKVDPQHAYRAALRVMAELTYQASTSLPLNLRNAQKIVNHFVDIITEDSAALLGVAALKDYDEDTYHHSLNVSILSLLIGSQLNLQRPLLVTLGVAGLLHDIGKVRVPREVVTNPGKFTPGEEAIMRRHTVLGAYALRELPGLLRLAMVVAFEHHANYDLSGYPQITTKETPHLLTRIVHIADVFDAATCARRTYRRPKRPHEILAVLLEGAGTTFDPVLAKLSVRVLADFSRKAGRPARLSRTPA